MFLEVVLARARRMYYDSIASIYLLLDRLSRLAPKWIEVKTMMHLGEHGLVSTAAWTMLMATLVICYATILAAVLGLVDARDVSLISFSGAMLGCIAAMVYLVAAIHDVHHRV